VLKLCYANKLILNNLSNLFPNTRNVGDVRTQTSWCTGYRCRRQRWRWLHWTAPDELHSWVSLQPTTTQASLCSTTFSTSPTNPDGL